MRMEGVVRKMQEILVYNHSNMREKMLLDPCNPFAIIWT
jgi:hypothetical protein